MSRGLKALCDANRIRILEILVAGEFCVSDLVERLGVDQPKVSHHLGILRAAAIIRSRRDGRHINYSVRPGVHRRQETPRGIMDVFDLGELSVSFRFGAGGEALQGAETIVVEPAGSQSME
jgi:DNA-binding transcriptional ArsR family regulator